MEDMEKIISDGIKRYQTRQSARGPKPTPKPTPTPTPAAAPKPTPAPKTTTPAAPRETFNNLVEKHQTSGMTRAKAMRQARRERPDLHQEWIAEANRPRPKGDQALGPFETKVLELVRAGKSRGAAYRQARQKHPELFKDYLARVRRGEFQHV